MGQRVKYMLWQAQQTEFSRTQSQYTKDTINQSWAYRSLKSLNRSSLLSKPSFWERWRSLRQRAEHSEGTDKIKF